MSVVAPILTLLRRRKRWILALVALVSLYAILGFLVLPAVLKAQLPPRLGAFLGREVQLGSVRANPFTFSVTLEKFLVRDRDHSPLLGWERLYVNLQASSLFSRTLSFKAIELAQPHGQVVVGKDGRLNFSDILDRLAKPGAAPEAAKSQRELAIGHLRVSAATVVLADHTPGGSFKTTLGPLTLELKGFHTARDRRNPYVFAGRTESGETFSWNGSFSVEPLRSEGSFALENLRLGKYHPYSQEQVAFAVREGLATARAEYLFEWSEGRHTLQLRQGSLQFRGLKICTQDSDAARILLPSVDLTGLEADLLESRLAIDSMKLADGRIEAVREPGGAIDLVKLLTPKPQPKAPDAKPFSLRLKELAFTNFRVGFKDQVPARPVDTDLDQLNLRFEGFDLNPATSVRLTLDGRVNGRGRLAAEGTAALLKPSVDLALKMDNLDLPAFDSYLEPAFDVRINRGALSLDGRLQGSFEGLPADAMAFKGRLRLDGFEAMDGTRQEVFLRYRSFRLAGLEVRTSPEVLKIQSVELLEPESRLVVDADGTTNVARALKLTLPPGGKPAAAAVPPTPAAPFAISIARIGIKGGRLSFIDRSLEPNAALLITELEGSYLGLSTEPDTQSAVTLKGRAGGLAPLLIQGKATPLRHDLDTDVSVKIQGAELSDFSPYAGKYLGYTIRKGKLEVDARLVIQKRRLDLQDKVRLDQFYLGDKVESPDATRLPVKLAFALLRDRKGIIDLELPVDGSLDDPDFHYGKVVWKAIVNVLGKLAASPFTLIGKLFGGGEKDLSFVTFDPGAAEPNSAATQTVEVLRKSLLERPDLTLEVEATTDPGADVAALRKQALERLLRQTKAKALRVRQPEIDEETLQLAPGEREQWLRAAFAAVFPAPPAAKETGKEAPPLPPAAELEQRLLGSFLVAPGSLKELADARTKALVKLLLQDGKLPAARVFETEGGERAKKEGGSRGYFSFK